MAGEISKRINQLQDKLTGVKLADEAFKVFRANTPIRSGNARRNTNLYQDSIEANYAYAQRLDGGYSPQAPRGMTQPTDDYISKWINKQSKG
jgi:hypothetical protein